MARYVEHSDQWTGPNRNPPAQLRGWYVNNDDGDPMTGPFDKEEEAFEELDYLNEKYAKPMRHCPHCFESSGYVWEHGNDWESGPWSHQTNIPCRFCNGDGEVPCDDVRYPDERDDDFKDVGYLAALSRVSLRGEVR